MSLDGLVARAGRYGAGGWGLPPEDPALKERKLEWLRDAGLHLMGRNTYEEMAERWPTSEDAYAAPMNDIPKVVFSSTLERSSASRQEQMPARTSAITSSRARIGILIALCPRSLHRESASRPGGPLAGCLRARICCGR